MKRYIIFSISFLILFIVLQCLSGIVLTMMYTPDIEDAWETSASLSQEVVLKGNSNSYITVLLAFLSATIAYFISRIVKKS